MEEEKKERPSWKMAENDEYLGNIWGWKFSFWGLAVMIVLGSLILYRYNQVGDWRLVKEDPIENPIDSLGKSKNK